MDEVKLIVDGARMAELLRSPTGVVGRHLIAKATAVQMAAKRQAPRRSGCLQDSIVKRWDEYRGELAVRIVSDTTPCSPSRTSYSYFVHEGTEPHVIVAAGNALAFHWQHGPNGAGVYFFKSIRHPGQKPNKFLTDNLPLAVA